MPTVTDLNTYCDAAIAAVLAGDNDTALLNLRAARMALVAIPDVTTDADGFRYDRQWIESQIADLESKSAAASGIQRTLINYVSPTT